MLNASSLGEDASILRDAIERACQGLRERRALMEAIVLAALAGEHVLVVGPPGTGRSLAARRVSRLLGGRYFEYLLGRSADPLELFGPIERRSGARPEFDDRTGMLADAEVAFLEEVFEVQTPMMNHLQWFLSERVFRRGNAEVRCALRVCVAAAAKLDPSPSLRTYDERFLVRAFVSPMADERLESLLTEGWERRGSTTAQSAVTAVGLARFDRLAAFVDDVEWPDEVRRALIELMRRIRAEGVEIADERLVRAQRLVAARAVLAGRLRVSSEHLEAVSLVVRTEEGQRAAEALARRPVTNTLRPISSTGSAALQTPSSVPAPPPALPRSKELVQTASYSLDAMRSMGIPVKPPSATTLEGLRAPSAPEPPRAPRNSVRPAAPRESAAPARRPRGMSVPPAKPSQSKAPSSAGRTAIPASYKRPSLPPPRRASTAAEPTPPFERPRPIPAPASDPPRSEERPKIPQNERPLDRTTRAVTVGALTEGARAALNSTVPDRGVQLEEWRVNVETILKGIDELSAQGVRTDTLKVLRGMLVDALDASWKKTASRGK